MAQAVTIGRGKVIKGLDLGLKGLCKGAHVRLIIPPRLAYGYKSHGPLPGGATVRYDVEIIDVKPESPNEFAKIDADHDGKLSKDEAKEYFDSKNQPIDIHALWEDEDKDKDGFISWDEFTGAKGDTPPAPPSDNEPLSEEDEKDFDEVVTLFKKIDTDEDLTITKKEMKTFLKTSNQNMKVDDVWNTMDVNADDKIEWDEFLQMHFLEKQRMKVQEEELLQTQKEKESVENMALFEKLDEDGDGRLSRKELSVLLVEAGLELTDEFWSESDGDGDGYISMKEFTGYLGGDARDEL